MINSECIRVNYSTSKNETHYSGFTQIVKVWQDLQNYFEDTFGMKQASKKICQKSKCLSMKLC